MQIARQISKINKPASYGYSILIIGILFFTFGFITWLNGSLIQFLKIACQLKTDVEAIFVTFAFYMAYFVLALPAAKILEKTGYKNGMALGLLVIAFGSLIFIPAANTRSFALFLLGLFTQGAGLALLQTASNPYISVIGPIEGAAKRISIMGICNKTAGILAPLILSTLLLKNASGLEQKINTATDALVKENLLNELTGRIITPYIVIAIALSLLAFLIKKSNLPAINIENDTSLAVNNFNEDKKSVFQFRHLILGVLCLFLYVGVEVMAGDAIGIYGKALGISTDETKYFTTFTLVAMLAGYVIGIATIPKIILQQTALKISAILGVVFTVCIFLTSGYTAITFIALLGLANALMWPAIFPLAITGLGKFTPKGSALLIMGIAGGAILPLIYAGLKEQAVGFSNHLSFLAVMLPSYIYILYYAVSGYKIKQK
jgi:MFS transporter, FHS family, L-fucose permease